MPTFVVEYRFFFSETEYQLMCFAGTDPEDWDEEDLIGVYTRNANASFKKAATDVREDMARRNIKHATFDVDFNIG